MEKDIYIEREFKREHSLHVEGLGERGLQIRVR